MTTSTNPIMNPFLTNNEFHLKAIQIYQKKYQGAGYYMEETTTKYIVEEQAKVSMYKIGNNKEFSTFLFKALNQAGRNLYVYIFANIGENRDTIRLNTESVMDVMGISRNTHRSALESLKDNGMITLYKKDEYWVNPFFIFRGDRIDYYNKNCPECIKIGATVQSKASESLVEHIRK